MKKPQKNHQQSNQPEKSSSVNFELIDSWINFIFVIIAPLLFLACWIHFAAEPRLIYHKQAPPFFADTSFINEFLNRPEGISQLLSAFMFQLHEFGFVGTLSEVLLATVTAIAGLFALNQFGQSKGNNLIFSISAFTVFFHIDYKCDPYHALINALFGYLSFILFARIFSKNASLSLLIFIFLCGSLSWFFTLGSFLFFLLSGLYALHSGKKHHMFAICLTYVLLIYILIIRSGFEAKHFDVQGSIFGRTAEITITLIAPLMVRIKGILKKLYEKGVIQKFKFAAQGIRSPIFYATVSAAICLELFFLARDYFHHNQKKLIQIDYFASRRQWDKSIDSFAKLTSYNNTAIVQLRRSLLHSGKLLDEFFSYPQLKEKYFFPDYSNDASVCMALAEFFYELGHINFAEHMGHESLEFDGAKPRQLILLCKINLLKGKTNTANIFAHRLGQNPFYKKMASKLISDIEAGKPFEDDKMFKFAKEFENTVSYAGYEVRDETFFNQLLVSNPKNRNAFECLIATLLANKNLPEAMRLVYAFAGFDFTTLPRHYEEAVLVWQVMEKHPQFVPAKYKLNPATIQRFNEFIQILEQHKGNLDSAKSELAEHFGTSYWYYYIYGEVYNPSLKIFRQK